MMMMMMMTALVVDDDVINQKLHQKLLQNMGIQNQVVNNGKEAIDVHLTKKFDLILMDFDMPIMNGIEATKKLREMGIESKIIGVSSHYSLDENVQEFVKAGLDYYQQKPLNKAKLLSILDKVNHQEKWVLKEQKQKFHHHT